MYPLELCAPWGITDRPGRDRAGHVSQAGAESHDCSKPRAFWKSAEQFGCTAMRRNDQDGMSRRHRKPRRRFEIVLLIPALLVFGGCMVGPDFQRPQTAVSSSWLETRDPRLSTGSATYRDWWTVFNDPALDRLVEQAYRENLPLRTAGVRVLQARAQLGIAIGDFFPQTQQGIGSVQYVRTSDRGAIAAGFGGIDYWQSQVGLQASWELDFWGKFRRTIQSADASLLSSLADYDNTLVTLTADVANSYITIRTAEERIRIARENVGTQEESLKIAEAKFKYGTVAQLDVEQARTSLLNTQATIPPLETQLRQARDALSVLLGMPPSDLSGLMGTSSTIPVSPPQVVVGIPTDLLRRRPDIRSAELQAAAQSAQIGVARAELFPAFSLTGSFIFLSTNLGSFSLSDMFRWGSRSVIAGPTVQWNIFNYGQITNNVRAQDAKFQELLIDYQNTVLKAQKEVEDGIATFIYSREQTDYLQQSVVAAEGALRIALLQYREGILDFTTVLTAEQNLFQAQNNLVLATGGIALGLITTY